MSDPSHVLQVLRDSDGKKKAEKFYETYTPGQSQDYARFAEFLIALDRLLQEFGGRPKPAESEEDEEHGVPEQDGQEYDVHENIHDSLASSRASPRHVDQVAMAIASVLKRKR